MATDGMVGFWDTVAYPAQAERLLTTIDGMPGPASAPFSGRSGRRVNGAGLAVSVSSTGNGSVTVSPGAGQIYSSAHAGHGRWPFYIPNSVGPLTLGARPAAGQTRIDLVVAQIYATGVAGSANEVKIEVVPGQAGVSASAPAVPPLSLLLDTLTVPATGTISHTQSTDVVVAAGGILPVQTTAEMDKLKTDGVAYPGLVINNAQTNALYRYDGTGWKALAEAAGDVQPLTVVGGWSEAGLGVSVEGRRAFLTGYINRANSGTFGGYASACQLPAGTFPGHEIYPQLAPQHTGTVTIGMKITAPGVMQIYMSAYSNALIPVEGVNWRL